MLAMILTVVAVIAFGCGVVWSSAPHFKMRKTLRQIRALPERTREKVR